MSLESAKELLNLGDSLLMGLEAIDDLPTIPIVIRKIEQAIENPDTTAKDVAAIIEDDPSIMARILKVVNSAFYRPVDGREISSLSQAVARLGFKTIKNIALTTSVFSTLGRLRVRSFDLNKFWQHCITTGVINSIVYDVCGGELSSVYGKDELHLMGLLHDMGKIVLEQYFNESFGRVLELTVERGIHISEAEREVLHATHAQVGAWLAYKWSLPPSVFYGILYHHEPEQAPKEHSDLVALTHIADFICIKGKFGFSGSSALPRFENSVWKHLGLDSERMSEILDRTPVEAKRSSVLLAILSSD